MKFLDLNIKSISSMMMFMATFMLSGCSDDSDDIFINDEIQIELEGDEMQFAHASVQPQLLNFNTNTNWLVRSKDSWVNLSQIKGGAGENSIEVTVDDNTEYEDRTSKLLIMCGRLLRTVYIKQSQKIGVLAEDSLFVLKKEAQQLKVDLGYNTDFNIIIPSECTWIRVANDKSRALEHQIITFDVDANTTTDVREVNILFSNAEYNVSDTIIVRQYDASEIVVPTKQFDVDCKEQVLDVEVSANVPVDIEQTEGTKSWISFKEKKTIGEKTYYSFNIAQNESLTEGRFANITFKNEKKVLKQTIAVNQEQYYDIVEFELLSTGQLKSLFDGFSGDKTKITKLVVTGAEMNKADFDALKEFSKAVYIDLSRTATKVIPVGQFQNNNIIQYIKLPNELTTLQRNAFNNSKIKSIYVPGTVHTWESDVFFNCKQLKEVEVAEGVTTIGTQAFANSEIEKIIIPTTIQNWVPNGNSQTRIFTSTTSLLKVKFPEGLTTLGAYMFNGSAIEEIYIPSTISTWGKWSGESRLCMYARSLKKIVFADGLKIIGKNAFPCNTVQTIISYSAVPPKIEGDNIGNGIGSQATGGLKVYVPAQSVDAYKAAPGWNKLKGFIRAIQ